MNRLGMLLAAFVLVIPAAAHAQFGGVVYDPTQAANAARQIQQGVQMYNTAVQSREQLINQYNQMKQTASSPSSYYTQYSNSGNQQWTPLTSSANTYGNTGQWMGALNNGSGAASANQAASVQRTGQISTSGLNTQGQQAVAATGATIDLGDSANATTLQTLGTVRANSVARESDIQKLEAASHSTNPADQTEQAALQRINQAELIQLRTQQETNQMLQAQAMQQMVQNKANQDAMKQSMQGAQAYQSTYQSYSGSLKTTGYTSH